MKTLPIGIEDFKIVVKNCYYVDKTRYIKNIVSLPPTSAILFTRPRRFGKSLFLSMLQTFFEKNIDDNPYDYFKNLEIFNNDEIIQEYMGKYPCIHLNMKDIFADTFGVVFEKAKNIIIEEIKRHYEIYNYLNEENKKDFDSLLDYNMNEATFTSSIKVFSRILENVYQIRPILLIDEYDSPFQASFNKDYFNKVVTLFKSFYGETIKGNSHIRVSILTGITRSAKLSLFSGINNIIVDTVLDEKYDTLFGFTIEEVEKMFRFFNKEFYKEKIQEWYGNYKFGQENILNPWSIMCFIDSNLLYKPYWSLTTTTSIIKEAIKKNNISIVNEIENLLNDEEIMCDIDKNINYENIDTIDSVLSFMLFMGYLTVSKENDSYIYNVKIPNREIKVAFVNEIKVLLKENNVLKDSNLIKDSLLKCDMEMFEKAIEKNILNSFSYFELDNERSYQVMLLILLSVLFDDCIVKSEVPAGLGRCDIMIYSKNGNDFGTIIEIKVLKSRTSLERMKTSSLDALKQIENNEYYKMLSDYQLKNVFLYGVCFSANKIVSSSKKIK